MKIVPSLSFFSNLAAFTLVLACSLSPLAAAPTWEWVQSVPNNGPASGVTVDGAGNVYWSGEALSGKLGTTPINEPNIFLSKLSSSGAFQWSKLSSAANGVYLVGSALTIDSQSNLILSGSVGNSSTVFGSPTTGAFTAKFNNSGDLTWLRNFANYISSTPRSAVAPDDSVTTIASFGNQAALDSFAITSVGNEDVMVLGMTSSGSARWLKRGGGTGTDLANALVIDAQGNSYVAGEYGYKATFGSFVTPTAAYQGGFMAKYGADGVTLWLQTAASQIGGYCSIGAAVVTPDGNVAGIGVFNGTIRLGDKTLTGSDNYSSLFLVRIDSTSGAVTSAEVIVPGGMSETRSAPLFATCDKQGTLRIAGSFLADFQFDDNY